MSGYITAAGENYLLDLLSNRRTALPYYYIALMKERPPSKFIAGIDLDEPNFEEYARAEYPNQGLYWTNTIGEISNTTTIDFPEALTDWGTIKHWAICDAATGGSVLWAGTHALPLLVQTGGIVSFTPGQLVLRVTSYQSRVSL